MQFGINIELDDEADETDIANAVAEVGKRASLLVTTGGPVSLDEDRHIAVQDIPAVWNASIFRHQ